MEDAKQNFLDFQKQGRKVWIKFYTTVYVNTLFSWLTGVHKIFLMHKCFASSLIKGLKFIRCPTGLLLIFYLQQQAQLQQAQIW